MTSESEEITVEDSDESLLDFKEIDDLEFDIPPAAPSTLEKVLDDLGSEDGSDTSAHSMTVRAPSLLSHCILQGVSTQISSAAERAKTGLPTVIADSVTSVAVGTSHGYVMCFDRHQNLSWYHACADEGATSALAFNLESTRLLVGYERGLVAMLDARTGDSIRRMADAHAPQSAVLHLRFAFLSDVAVCGDSSGCVFTLTFNKRLGVRTWDSKCLFSGARGEVCAFEPLVQGHDVHFLSKHVLVAMATLSKIIVVSVKPRLKVHFNQALPKLAATLPLLAWQPLAWGKTFQPVLAWARGHHLHYARLITSYGDNRIRVVPLRKVELAYSLTALHWLGARHLALLDVNETLRLVEVRGQRELEALQMGVAGLVYGSAHFKALAVGGGVSEAFALAGERACYNSLSSRSAQLLVLGTKAVHMVRLRSWSERITFLSDQGRWAEALNLASDEGLSRETFTVDLLTSYLATLTDGRPDRDGLTAVIGCCVKLDRVDILCNEVIESLRADPISLEWYCAIVAEHVCHNGLRRLSPSVCQILVDFLQKTDPQLLETVLLSLDLDCLDLHQVLKVSKRLKLYNAWIHVTTKTLKDYTAPLVEFLSELTPVNHRLGNTLLVYVSSCLAGLGYPTGYIEPRDVSRVKCDVLRCLETVHSINRTPDEKTYPYLRALLRYNIRECLNVIKLAFTEAEFSGEMGILQRERLVNILTEIVTPPEFQPNEVTSLACFIARSITADNLSAHQSLLHVTVNALTADNVKLSARDRFETEQALLDLLDSGKLRAFDTRRLLEMALRARFFTAARVLMEARGEYGAIVACFLDDERRASEVFGYVRQYADRPERRVAEQVRAECARLVECDCAATASAVVERWPEMAEAMALELDDELRFAFVRQLVANEFRLSAPLAEWYLEELCAKEAGAVRGFVARGWCARERALEITRKYGVHEATALLLENGGEWFEALNLLLANDRIDSAVALCARATDHLDPEGAQRLWLALLRTESDASETSLRRLLHAATPHVPPDQLLELLSNVNYGEVKRVVRGMLRDYGHDVSILEATLRVLNSDLHCSLAQALHQSGRAIAVDRVTCDGCARSLARRPPDGAGADIFVCSCGLGFHASCAEAGAGHAPCLAEGRGPAFDWPAPRADSAPYREARATLRPDLEGHF